MPCTGLGSLCRPEYVPALCTHRPSLLPIELYCEFKGPIIWKFSQTELFKGKRSRNKASVGEPADGSLRFPRYKHKQLWLKLYKTSKIEG